jgi:chemosensory pili system protein ChpC
MAAETSELRTILAPIDGGHLLLPGSVVAEVIELSDLHHVDGAPDWLVGEVVWQDWRVPVISYALLGGTVDTQELNSRCRVLVIKSLGEDADTPYIGILISGVPRLSMVTAPALTEPDSAADNPCVFRSVTLDERRVLIPDLDELLRTLAPAMAKT